MKDALFFSSSSPPTMDMEPRSWPESAHLPADQRRAISELVKGRDFALQLLDLVHSNNNNTNPVDQDLVRNILGSFNNTLSILKRKNNNNNHGKSDEVSQVPSPTLLAWDPAADVAFKSEDSEGSTKYSSRAKDRRGCYKGRKFSDSFIKESSTLVDDGHAWRKYGQKVILKTKYPRNYFRCTHRHEQGCLATKQVQQIDENPPLYRSTYFGRHTCKNLLKASQLLMDSSSSKDQSSMISFGNNTHITDKQNYPYFFSFSSSVKQENKDEYNKNPSSASDHHHYLLPHQDYDQLRTLLSSEHGDVISGGNSSCSSLEMEAKVVESVEFDDDILQFDF